MSNEEPGRANVVGGTVVAIVVALIVLAIVSVIAAAIFGAIQYYMSSMRIEAALFFGAIFGGWAGVYASRAACDAVLKHYSLRTIFITFALMCALSVAGEAYKGFEWSSLTRMAQIATILITSWIIFWNDDYS